VSEQQVRLNIKASVLKSNLSDEFPLQQLLQTDKRAKVKNRSIFLQQNPLAKMRQLESIYFYIFYLPPSAGCGN